MLFFGCGNVFLFFFPALSDKCHQFWCIIWQEKFLNAREILTVMRKKGKISIKIGIILKILMLREINELIYTFSLNFKGLESVSQMRSKSVLVQF